HGERNVALGGEAVEDARDLERSCQPEPRTAGGRQPGDVAPVEHDSPRIRLELAGQLSDQRGLAGALWTDERMGFALADGERHVVGGDERAERLAQMLDLEQEFAHFSLTWRLPAWNRRRARAPRGNRPWARRACRRRSRAPACPKCRPSP